MKRKYIHTDFIKFIVEKYSKDPQGEEDEEEIDIDSQDQDDEDNEEPQLPKKKKSKKVNEFDDEENIDGEEGTEDDAIIDELLNEYKRLKRKHENNKLYKRRKL
jgi:hypothetical protein